MDKKLLFDSKTEPIPEVRRDLQIIPVAEDGNSYLYFYDERGYATQDLALNQQVSTLLSLLDGRKSINDLEPYLGQSVNKDQVLEFIQVLDENRLLSSEYFQDHAEKIEGQYEQSTVHKSVTAGESYPADPEKLTDYLDELFAKYDEEVIASPKTKALYAPHIDPRVAQGSFVKAFAPIKKLSPKRVVILATSHYAGLHPDKYENTPFVLVNKDFELPLCTLKRDQKAIEKFIKHDNEAGVTTHDRAHRIEHSIELHLLFLSYLWDHEFKIVPFLTRDLDDIFYMEDGHLGKQIDNFSERLRNHFGDDETFFLISGDLAHFGKKFGDQSAASTMFEEVKQFDQRFLEAASQNHRKEMLGLMKEDMDPYRICGFPPLYTFLQSMPGLKGKVLGYDLWDERETESAVTFGSILYSE